MGLVYTSSCVVQTVESILSYFSPDLICPFDHLLESDCADRECYVNSVHYEWSMVNGSLLTRKTWRLER